MITRSISKAISRGIALAINDPSGAGFDPLSLFAAGEQGAWYDPSDLTSLFQDAAGTIPVTAAGQPVGMMRDKSGRGNHATQSTATSRPILQTDAGKWYLVFDGVDDWLLTAAANFTATDEVTVCAGITKASDAAFGLIVELSASLGNNGTFGLYAPLNSATPNYAVGSKGTVSLTSARTGFAAPHTSVLTGISNISGPRLELRVNGTAGTPTTSSQGTGNYGNYPLYIGRRGGATNPFNGNLYSLLVRGGASTAQQITDTEQYVNSKTGAY